MCKALLSLILLLAPLGRGWAACAGDCRLDGEVTVDEIVMGVNLALGNGSLAQCQAFDRNGSGDVTIDEVISAVNNALQGCPAITPVPTVTATPTVSPTTVAGTQPQLPDPRPTAAAGCDGGYAVTAFRDGSPDANSYLGFSTTAGTSKTTAAVATITPMLFSFGGSYVDCPAQLGHAVRLITFTIGGIKRAPVAGTAYALKPGYDFTGEPTVAQVDYLEQVPGDAFGGRGWRAQSGTLTVESYDGVRMQVRIGAEMKAEKQVFPIGSAAPLGTFHLEAVVVIDQVAQR